MCASKRVAFKELFCPSIPVIICISENDVSFDAMAHNGLHCRLEALVHFPSVKAGEPQHLHKAKQVHEHISDRRWRIRRWRVPSQFPTLMLTMIHAMHLSNISFQANAVGLQANSTLSHLLSRQGRDAGLLGLFALFVQINHLRC